MGADKLELAEMDPNNKAETDKNRQSCNIFKVQKVGMDLVGTVCAVSVMAGLVLRAECDFQHYLEICCSGMS